MSQEAQPEPRLPLASAFEAFASGDFHTRELAALSDLDRAGVRAVALAWSELPEEIREGVIRGIDALADQELSYTFGRFLRIALDDPSPVVRQLAVAALWEDDGSDLRDRFLQMVAEDPSEDVRAAAARSLEGHADTLARTDEQGGEFARSLAAVARDEAEAEQVRRAALETLGVFAASRDANDLIVDAFDGDEPGLRVGALYAMGRSGRSHWMSRLVEAAEGNDLEERYEAARAMGRIGDDEAVPTLADLAIDADPEVRNAAIQALGSIGGAAATRVLRSIAEQEPDIDPDVIAAALDDADLDDDDEEDDDLLFGATDDEESGW